ncbi:MAG: Gfo/Idh/MocA family oxidoreductase [Clostridia bacterium]|nr:Gfo/Idh/MocA family oxidoreductase [Clostridia bacterium]
MAIKVGIVGMGGIGKTHARCYQADELAELVCVCDVIKERADAAAEEFGVRAFYDLKEMLSAHPELDLVDVTTSGFDNGSWHYEPVMQALDAGFNAFVEKPISNNNDEAREMVITAAKKGLYLGCNLNHGFTEPADKARELIAQGKIGQPVYILHKVGFNGGEKNYTAPLNDGIPKKFQGPYSHAYAFLSHPFSLMRSFGGDITHVQAFFDKPGVRRSGNDLMWSINGINCQFQNGSIGYLLSQRGDAHFGLGGWWSFEMAGTKGTFCIENCVEKLYYWDASKKGNNMATPKPKVYDFKKTDFGLTFGTRLHAFLEDMTNKVPPEHIRASGRDALATLEYTVAAITSFEEGGALVRPRALPPIHGTPGYVKL